MSAIKNKIEKKEIITSDNNDNPEILQNEIIDIIWNFILKSLFDNITLEEHLILDNISKVRCKDLQKILKPKNLDIPEEIIDKNFIIKIKEHLKRIEQIRTPGEILKQFAQFIESINSLYKFFLNLEMVEPDELLNTIIYFILISAPENITFKTNFCKFFLDEEELVGNVGISVAQIESSLIFINKLKASQIGISQKEFDDIFSKK